MKKSVIVFIAALLAAMLLAAVVAVCQPIRVRPPVSSAGQTPLSSARQRVQDQRAKVIQERIETTIARFNNNKARHTAVYNNIKAKVTDAVATLAANGYDTSKLATDLATYNDKIVKYATDYATFIGLLQTAEQYAPYASQGQFLNAMAQARAQLRTVRQDDLELRNYYQSVIRPDIAALKSQTPKTPAPTTPTGSQ